MKKRKKEKKTIKILEKQIANEELKTDLQTPKSLSKKFNLRNKLKKSSVHKNLYLTADLAPLAINPRN